MEPALVTLASTAASTLVAAMTTDAWRHVRDRLARLLGRGDRSTEAAVLAVLDEDAHALAVQPSMVEDVSVQWSVRLRDLLRVDPEAAAVLRELVAELPGPRYGVAAGRDVTIRADRGGVAAGVIDGGVHMGNPRSPDTGPA
jgi:hypothetical protein